MTTDNYDLEVGGVKFDAGKLRMDLVPMESILAEAAVYTYGAMKYDDWNWAKGMRKGRIVAALLRHTAAYLLGEEIDPESGLPHTWHMRCCTGMLVAACARGVADEDRQINVEAYENIMKLAKGMKQPEVTSQPDTATPPVETEDYSVDDYSRMFINHGMWYSVRMVDWVSTDVPPPVWFKEGTIATLVKTPEGVRIYAPGLAPTGTILPARTKLYLVVRGMTDEESGLR